MKFRSTLACILTLNACSLQSRHAPGVQLQQASAPTPPPVSSTVHAAPETPSEPNATAGQNPTADVAPQDTRMRIVSIDMTMDVVEVGRALRSLRSIANELGGYVENSEFADIRGGHGHITLRIPKNKIREFRAQGSRIGSLASESETSVDVTDQYTDVEARMRNAQREEERLLELLLHRTGSLADVLTVEREVARVRQTVEQMQAQIRGLEGQAEFIKVSIGLRPPSEECVAPTDAQEIARAFHEGISAAEGFTVGMVCVCLVLGPVLILMAFLMLPLFFLARRLLRRLRLGLEKTKSLTE